LRPYLERYWQIFLVVLGISACVSVEPSPPLDFGVWPTSKVEVSENLGVRVDLLEGPAVPMARLLAEEVSDRLTKARVPATVDPTRPSRYVLKGRTKINLLRTTNDDYLHIKWELQDNVGQIISTHTQGIKATRTQWEFGDPRIIRSVGNGVVKPLLAMLSNSPRQKAKKNHIEPEDTDIIAEQSVKIDVNTKVPFSEISESKNSSSYANQPLPEAPPISKTILISKTIKLVVGTKGRLGTDINVDLVKDNKCVEKTRHNILFCLERVPWPSGISKTLRSPLSLMGDNMAMIRYDGGKASQIHLNFPTDAFDKLVEYFEKKYGPPNEYPKILMRRIGVPAKENPTVRWRAVNPEMRRNVILEIRKTDDLRSILPAEGTGVARLYSYGDEMIFRYVSTADIMLMRMKYSTTRR
jgi:hypothetical protein